MTPIYKEDPTNGLFSAMAKVFNEEEIPMTARDVPESIGDSYLSWEAKHPVLIDAPTGSHKTTFVYTKLIDDTISRRQHLILISNRIALTARQRLDVLKILSDKYPHLIDGLMDNTEKEIDEINFIGPVCVCTYQGLHSLINRPDLAEVNTLNWFNRLRYAVFDEIDFLYSDALFNSMCGFWAKRIPLIFKKAIRVYITATSWEIKDTIMYYEQNVLDTASKTGLSWMEAVVAYSQEAISNEQSLYYYYNRKLKHYYMKPDYSAYRLHFFGETSDSSANASALLSTMNPLPSEFNKWVIFVHQKSTGQKLKETLKRKAITAKYIDASRKDAVKTIVNNPYKLKDSVLISTSVISNGVNLNDSTVKNIGIFCLDRTLFVQQIGRRRLDPGETIDLWVWLPGKSYLENLIERIKWHLDMADSLRYEAYVDAVRRLWEDREKISYDALFYIDEQGKFRVSDYTEQILSRQLEFIQKLTDPDSPSDFRAIVEGWLGIKASAPLPISESSEENSLESELDCHIDTELTIEEFAPIRKKIVTSYKEATGEYIRPDRKDTKSANSLNNYLIKLNLPYKVQRKNNLWQITKQK